MKKLYFLSIIVLAMFTSSCVTYITPPITGGNNIGYLPRPVFEDSVPKSKTYISGEYAYSSVDNESVVFNTGMLNLSRGYTHKSVNYGFGAFAFLGNANSTLYNDNNGYTDVPDFNKNFYGFGLRSTIGLHVISDNQKFNFRIINWENAFSSEKGDYANYRKALYNDGNGSGYYAYVSKLTNIYTTGFSSEIVWTDAFEAENLEVSVRAFLGFSPRLGRSYKEIDNSNYISENGNVCVNTSIYVKYNKIFGTVQIGGDKNFGSRFAIGYAF